MKEAIIAFTKRSAICMPKLLIAQTGIGPNIQGAMTLQTELMNLGYIMDMDTLSRVSHFTNPRLVDLYNDLIPFIRTEKGATKHYRPFYPNFPREVMEKSDTELLLNQLMHYWTTGSYEPVSTGTRPFEFETVKFKTVGSINTDQFASIFTSVVGANGSITEFDKEVIRWFVANKDQAQLEELMPTEIPFKENLAVLATELVGIAKLPLKTATDVLRVAVGLSGGDVSLPTVPKRFITKPGRFSRNFGVSAREIEFNEAKKKFRFKKFNRATRRYLLALLDAVKHPEEDMKRHLGRWLRLGEILHPGEYQTVFPNAFMAFDTLRNRPKLISTFESRVEKYIKAGDVKKVVDLLVQRPGVFARRLDHILRKFAVVDKTSEKIIMEALQASLLSVSTPLLAQLHTHFQKRTEAPATRVFKSKGATNQSAKIISTILPVLPEQLVKRVQTLITMALKSKFAQLPPMGKVWVNPILKNAALPTGMRSVSGAFSTPRGVKTAIEDHVKTVRCFVHWNDPNGSEDLDLSAVYITQSNSAAQLNFASRGLKAGGALALSGDVRMRSGACAEYIDIDLDAAKAQGLKYVIVNVTNYQGRPMNAVGDEPVTTGWMAREKPNANEVFDAKTIQESFQVKSSSKGAWLFAFDVVNRQAILLDFTYDDHISVPDNEMNDIVKAYFEETRYLSFYDVLTMHGEMRGTLVETAEEADVILDTKLVNEYDVFLSEFLK